MSSTRILAVLLIAAITGCTPSKNDSDNNMILVEGESFIMGTSAEIIDSLADHYGFPRDFIGSEFPPHTVTLSHFYIDRYEASNEDFKKFLDDNPKWQKSNISDSLHNGNYLSHWNNNTYPIGENNYPIYNISWYAAYAYCKWQNKRLPTEAEWEYVASSRGKNQIYPWGNSTPDSSKANYNNIFGKAIEIGSYSPNELGVYDLAGNVWEFTVDEWSSNYYSISPENDPVNGNKHLNISDLNKIKTRRVIRGGSWGGADINLRVSFRDSHPPKGADNYIGCRCVKDITTTSNN